MKEIFAAIGIVTVVGIAYILITKSYTISNGNVKEDCGCGCGGDSKVKTTDSIKNPKNPMHEEQEHNCNPTGLGEGWVTNYDLQKEFEGMTVNRA